MIASVLGIIISGGAISLLSHSVNSNAAILKDIHLNQELRTIMNGIVKDIRRAGYWQQADGVSTNPYSNIFVSEDKTCILYSYDTEPHENQEIGDEDNYGIRLLNNTIRIREKSSGCNTSRFWRSVTDNSSIKISTLVFATGNLCTNISTSDRSCKNADVGDVLAIKHIIDVTLSGHLNNNPKNSLTLKEKIVVRNSESKLIGDA